MSKIPLKRFEIALVLLALVMLIQGVIFYVNDYPLVRAMLGLSEEGGKVLVGYVIKKEGTLQRQLSGDTGFKSLEIQKPVFNKDVLVTGPGSGALIQFQKGGGIQMGPSSMIRLSFVTGLELGGIKRHTSVELVSGKVVNQSTDDAVVLKAQGKTYSVKANKTQGLEVSEGAGAQVKATDVMPLGLTNFDFIPQHDLMAMVDKLGETHAKEAVKPPPPPPPPPPPKVIRVGTPHFDQSEVISDSQIEKNLRMRWEISPPNQSTQVAFWRLSENRKSISKEPVQKGLATVKEGQSSFEWKAVPPGLYVWEILDEKGIKISGNSKNRGELEIGRKMDIIQMGAPLIAGKRSYTNKLEKDPVRDFDVSLEWKPVPGVKEYEILFSKSATGENAMKLKTDTNQFKFSKNQVLSGVRFYRVQATLENGYVAQSPLQKLTFQFLPPALVVPGSGIVLSKKQIIREDQNRILFTWEKTNFTSAYEIEVAKDETFQSVLIKKTQPDNYFLLNNPNAGQYFWRVRSISKDIASQMSPPQHFTVTP